MDCPGAGATSSLTLKPSIHSCVQSGIGRIDAKILFFMEQCHMCKPLRESLNLPSNYDVNFTAEQIRAQRSLSHLPKMVERYVLRTDAVTCFFQGPC